MLSEARHSTRSPSESVQTESVRTGPTFGGNRQPSIRSSISEESSKKVPPAPPLPATIRAPVKSPTKSSSSSTSSLSSETSSSRTQTTQKSKSSARDTNTAKPISGTTLSKLVLRRGSSEDKPKNGRQVPIIGTKKSEPKQKTTGFSTSISARDFMNDKSVSTLLSNFNAGKNNQSVFEKVNTHDGHTSYLGSGTFFDLENCISDCLSKNRCHTDRTYHSSRHHDPCKSLTRASVLEDYSYDGIIGPKHHTSYSSSNCHNDYDYCHTRNDHHRHHSDAKRHAAELSLEEIRQVNDSLAKYGIPVFSHHDNPHHHHHQPHSVGEIVSACRLLLNEPRLAGLHNNGQQAVQHVWDAIQHHPMPPPPPNHGYASPALQGVASHLFHPNQAPYDPVHGVASHLFGSPQQPPHNFGSPSGGASHFFAPSQPPHYNPGPPPPQYNPGPPPPQYNPGPPPPPQSSGQSVLSRLFGRA